LHLLQVSSSYMNPQPAHATSTGKVMLAFAHPSVVQAILSKGLPARTGKTITRPEAFLEELDAIRERSYATNIGELEEGMCAIGAPIRDGKGQVIAAISLGGPVVRVSAERIPEIAQAVIETGNRISQDLGWKPSVARGALSGLGI
jgi:DNA-binding IclR family transcriptional regulator